MPYVRRSWYKFEPILIYLKKRWTNVQISDQCAPTKQNINEWWLTNKNSSKPLWKLYETELIFTTYITKLESVKVYSCLLFFPACNSDVSFCLLPWAPFFVRAVHFSARMRREYLSWSLASLDNVRILFMRQSRENTRESSQILWST